ncbi:MAG: asparaginase [Boseongicola sp.]|nr:MAG: asparaginase [Boseongicola sp.]
MSDPVLLAETTRGPFVESRHFGHAVISRADGSIVESWGNPTELVFARSAAKILQALPLVESGAGTSLSTERLALACASHSAERRHVEMISDWLGDLGLDEHALCCGPQASRDEALAEEMIKTGEPVTRAFNWCSGKHSGFLTLSKHLGAELDYVNIDHPVQLAVREAFEDMTGMDSPGFGFDGCSAPNFATNLSAMARAMAVIAAAEDRADVRGKAASELCRAMIAHPEMVGGEGRVDTELMRVAREPVAIKSGAEGFYVAIIPGQKLGIALKVSDGASRGSEVAIAALLVRLGVLDINHPVVSGILAQTLTNWAGLAVGSVRPAEGLLA